MKFFCLLLFLPILGQAQSLSCGNASLLYSRELYPGPVTVDRAMSLSEFGQTCIDTTSNSLRREVSFEPVKPLPNQNFQYYPLDPAHQPMFGNNPFPATTEQMVNHLFFDRK